MASSDNLTSLEPWLFRPAFPADPWLSDAFACETDVLTRALTASISIPAGFSPCDDSLFNVFDFNSVVSSPSPNLDTPRGSGQSVSVSVSGSDPDTATKKSGRRGAPGPASGRVAKRKSRASKKSPTTFITADAENFRQMVQHVTGGAMFSAAAGDPSMLGTIVKPAAHRLAVGGRIQGYLPTLDTSAFFIEHHQQVVGQNSTVVSNPDVSAAAFASPSGPEIGCDGSAGSGGLGVLDIGSLSCFPTLDSWEVM